MEDAAGLVISNNQWLIQHNKKSGSETYVLSELGFTYEIENKKIQVDPSE